RIFYTKGGRIVAHEGVTSRLPGTAKGFFTKTGEVDQTREFYNMRQRMKRMGADGYYLLHNHPSGEPAPSQADVHLTAKYARNVPGFHGHIVIDHERYSVIDRPAQGGRFSYRLGRVETGGSDSLLAASIPHDALNRVITRASDLVRIGRQLQAPEGFVSLIHRGTNGRVRAIQEMPSALRARPKEAGDFIRGQQRNFGATHSFIYSSGGNRDALAAALEMIRSGVLTDYVESSGRFSARDRTTPGKPSQKVKGIRVEEAEPGGRRVREPVAGWRPDTAAFAEKLGVELPYFRGRSSEPVSIQVGDRKEQLKAEQAEQLERNMKERLTSALDLLKNEKRFKAMGEQEKRAAANQVRRKITDVERDRMRLTISPNYYSPDRKDAADWKQAVKEGESLERVVRDAVARIWHYRSTKAAGDRTLPETLRNLHW
ncbi:MAG TPA: JAB domain-containing protein, partial [Blastocatellia bacterium]|nr:JAB domain-containing protein [Blastocatellia bacterium]